jgi:Bacterial regulatory helix-turn-helix protein, lysR family
MRPNADPARSARSSCSRRSFTFARTAVRLGLTHSRVSQIIRSLEAQVGGRLFDRTSRRESLTPVGEQLRADLASPYELDAQGEGLPREAVPSG